VDRENSSNKRDSSLVGADFFMDISGFLKNQKPYQVFTDNFSLTSSFKRFWLSVYIYINL
jgi:hypothetical protein